MVTLIRIKPDQARQATGPARQNAAQSFYLW